MHNSLTHVLHVKRTEIVNVYIKITVLLKLGMISYELKSSQT